MKLGAVLAVHKSETHSMKKWTAESVTLIKGLGVEGDVHAGKKVKHRSRVAKDPNQPNLRQVHLIHAELYTELQGKGFKISPGDMGENITTFGVDLLGLPRNTLLHIGNTSKVRITGLRNPCYQLDDLQKGLMRAVLDKDYEGNLILKAGVMGIVLEGGKIVSGDEVRIELPPEPYQFLEKV